MSLFHNIREDTPFVQVDAEGRIVGGSNYKSATFANYIESIRAGSISGGFSEIAATATPVPLTPGELDGTEDADILEVELVAGQTYTFDYRGTDGGLVDPYLALFGPEFVYITEDDDGGAGRGSMITYTPTESGTYYLYATSFYTLDTGNPSIDTGGYTINMWSPEADVPGSTNVVASIATAVDIGLGTYYGNMDVELDNDYFALEVTEGMVYTIGYAGGVWGAADRDGEAGENLARLTIYDANGVQLATNFNYESGLSYFAAESTTIYIRAAGSNEPAAGGTGGYTLDITEVDPTTRDPLESLNWDSANNIPTVMVDGVPTAYVYFAAAGENFGETADNGVDLMTTYGWTQKEMDAVMLALEQYTPITGINYEITTDVDQATFRLLTTTSTQYGAYFYPQAPGSYGTQQGIGVFNINSGGWDREGISSQQLPGDQVSLDQGGFAFGVILHEFGHAHGIAHPHDTGGGSEVMLGVNGAAGYGVYDLNQGVYTVMSYNDAWDTGPNGPSPYTISGIDNGWSGTLGAFDIAVLQARYGVHDNNEGNTNYALTDVANDAYYQTIWDSGGNDTISYNGALDAQIDLTAATLDYTPTGGGVVSFIDGVFGGYTIAAGAVIENATGGSGNDALLGNDSNNVLTGNAGDDVFLGRGGDDKLYGGSGDDALDGGTGNDQLFGGAGMDTFVFADAGTDLIRDYQAGEKIDLSALGVTMDDVTISKQFILVDLEGSDDLRIMFNTKDFDTSDLIFADVAAAADAAFANEANNSMADYSSNDYLFGV